MEKKKIYFDYGATTPIDKEVLKKALPFLKGKFGNPSSLHSFGQDVVFAIDEARAMVAKFLQAKEREIIFTSSATEANNIAILGFLQNKRGHIITTTIEHKAVLDTLKSSGLEITYISPSKEGIIDKEKVLQAIKEDTIFISIMYANNEIGTIQPIQEIGEELQKINENREKKIIFHTDAVQAVNYLSCNVDDLKVDLLTMSGHKIYGPKGVGVLYIKEGVNISPILHGGAQEKAIRPGTENVFAIVGMGLAIENLHKNNAETTKFLRDKIIDNIEKTISDISINGDRQKRLPNNVAFSVKGVEGESMMFALDREGIAVSTGSACASRSLVPSHVLLSLGMSHEKAHGSLRITLGRFTTEKEVDYLLQKLPPIIEKLRKISPLK